MLTSVELQRPDALIQRGISGDDDLANQARQAAGEINMLGGIDKLYG